MYCVYIEYEGTRFEKFRGFKIDDWHWKLLNENRLKATAENIALADDWMPSVVNGSNWSKYGRFMYSPKLDRLRDQSILEFYDGNVVD